MKHYLLGMLTIGVFAAVAVSVAVADEQPTCASDETLVYFTDKGAQCIKRQVQPQTPTPQIDTTEDEDDDGSAG